MPWFWCAWSWATGPAGAGGAWRDACDAHLAAALRDVKPTTLEWLTTARNYARYANESGQYDEVLRFLEQHGKG